MAAFKTAADLGRAIRGARVQKGLSQSDLAQRSGVSRKLVRELEAGNETVELGPVLRVAAALGLSWQAPEPTPQAVLDEAADAVRAERLNGDIDFALRLALDAVKRLRAMGPTTLKRPPATGDPRWDALLAAGARIALRGTGSEPHWGLRLDRPWFPAEDMREISDAYRQLTVRRTPKEFADFNIFLNDDSVVGDHEDVVTSRPNGKNVVIVSEEEYSSIKETAYLLSSPANAARLLSSIDNLKTGLGVDATDEILGGQSS